MLRGAISNVGAPCVWIMREVLFTEEGVRADRAEWLRNACLVMRVVVILKAGESVPDIDLPIEYKIFRFLEDAQRALSRDSEPVFLVTENIDDLSKETFSFTESLFSKYQMMFR